MVVVLVGLVLICLKRGWLGGDWKMFEIWKWWVWWFVVEKCECRYLEWYLLFFPLFFNYFSLINSFIFSTNLFPKNVAWLLLYGGGGTEPAAQKLSKMSAANSRSSFVESLHARALVFRVFQHPFLLIHLKWRFCSSTSYRHQALQARPELLAPPNMPWNMALWSRVSYFWSFGLHIFALQPYSGFPWTPTSVA